jgi:diphosphomevalonate decarboxylase
MTKAKATAHANIAIVKYWGKRDDKLLLPQAASLSVALDKLLTTTTVELGGKHDSFELDGKPEDGRRVRLLLDAAGISQKARIVSRNEFPTAAGLASSASGFAALVVAACGAAGLKKSTEQLSALARLGSGSATRSVPGGWAVWEDEGARQVFPPEHLPIRFVIAICAAGPKDVNSRDGMKLTRETSPYHPAWLEQCVQDLPDAIDALMKRDLPSLGALAERNALRMHADALAADPPLIYWQPATVACLHELRKDRPRIAWATIDAGPHVVALCAPEHAKQIEQRFRGIPGVQDVLVCAPAGGARLVP